MSVKTGQGVTVLFATADPTTGAATNGDSLPTGTLYLNGTANGASVTVTNVTMGLYKAAVTMPALAAGDLVSLKAAATVATVAAVGVAWQDVGDTAIASDVLAEAVLVHAHVGTIDGHVTADYGATEKAAIDLLDDANGLVNIHDTLDTVAGYVDTEVAAILAAVDTEVAAILADTNELQTDLVNGGRLDLILDAIQACTDRLTAARAGYVDKLANLPAAPAATGDAMTLTSAYDKAKDDVLTPLTVVDGNVDAILVDTGTTLDGAIADLHTDVGTVITDVGAIHTHVNDIHDTDLPAVKTDTAAILADTNELQGEWVDGGRLDLILDAASAPSAATVADAVWDEATSGHVATGSTGKALTDAGSAGTPLDAAGVRAAVGMTSANLDTQLGALPTDADVNAACDAAISDAAIPAGVRTNLATELGRLDENVSAAKTLTSDERTSIATAVWAATTRTLSSFGSLAADVWAAATRSLTDKAGFTLHADYDAAKTAAPIAAANADAVWDEALAGHATTGSAGKRLTDAAAAADPWLAELPGTYEAGTAGALLPDLTGRLIALGAVSITVTSPVAPSGAVSLYAGDDYEADIGRALTFLIADASHLLGLDAGTVSFKCDEATWTGTAASTTAGYAVTFEPTHAQTAALTITRQSYELEAVLADGDVVTLATGTLVVTPDIPSVA